MAQCNSSKKIICTGDDIKERQLLYQLQLSLKQAQKVDFIVSFLMESGVKLLLPTLKQLDERNVPIRILTGNYLGITQPSALYLLKNELKNLDLRFYDDEKRSFHPKAYFIELLDKTEVFIGSSNISKSALTSGIEWNYHFTSDNDFESYQQYYHTFNDLFENHSIIIDDKVLKDYAYNWCKPSVYKHLETYDHSISKEYEPREAQIEALYALKQTREQGATKALIKAATGIGKTYLAAFDSKKFDRILFVAHREEILKQAAISFANVRKSNDYGFLDKNHKDYDKSVIFASIATLAKVETLSHFKPDTFDYIVIDEFHHAASNQYLKVVDYFKPKFLLGLSATPMRLDGKSIYALCDYNVPYEIDLREGINRGMLVPFHYYGIYDEVDYSSMRYFKGEYAIEDLNIAYNNQRRYDLIYKYYCKYGSNKAIGFCCSKEHALAMSKDFNKRGIASCAVYSNASGEYTLNRDEAIKQLNEGQIKVIFAVDMFNEGIDIQAIDMVLFLRPTQSPTIFLQQLGRGLRLYEGKTHLNVLDFIGNYKKANKVPTFLSGVTNNYIGCVSDFVRAQLPQGCLIDFDLQLIDLFETMDQKNRTIKEKIKDEYYRIKDMLEVEMVSRVQLYTYMDADLYETCISNTKTNVFKNYYEFLKEMNELDQSMFEIDDFALAFLHELETTSMSRVYKMPVLLAFYNNGHILMDLDETILLDAWKKFFKDNLNYRDLKANLTYSEYLLISDKEHLKNIKKNPVNFLKKSGKDFFIDNDNYVISLHPAIKTFINKEWFRAIFKDIIEYRVKDYYERRYQGNN